MREKKWKQFLKKAVVLCFVFGIFIALYVAIFANAFQEYEVTPSNDFQIEVKQKRSSSSSGIKYSTAGWYLFKEKTGAAENTTTDNGIALNASYYNKYGFNYSHKRVKYYKDGEDALVLIKELVC